MGSIRKAGYGAFITPEDLQATKSSQLAGVSKRSLHAAGGRQSLQTVNIIRQFRLVIGNSSNE